jgi:excisionase family DNA binding protein
MKKSKPSPVSVAPSVVSSNPEPFLTREQVAARLCVEPSTVYELTKSRNRNPIPYSKIGKYQRFRWSEIEKWLVGCQKRTAA